MQHTDIVKIYELSLIWHCMSIIFSKALVSLVHVILPNGDRFGDPRSQIFTDKIKKGVFVVPMKVESSFFHSICINYRGDEGFIYDSFKPYALKLKKKSLVLHVVDYNS